MAMNLNIRINSPVLERLIKHHTGADGLYENVSELVREALRNHFKSLDAGARDESLRQHLIEGLSDLGEGRFRPLDLTDIEHQATESLKADGLMDA